MRSKKAASVSWTEMDSESLKRLILENASEIVRLHSRIHEALPDRDKKPAGRREWEQACAEFHTRYNTLAFPGGYVGALGRISAGDPQTMEAAICFLECRPYFFRSGYMFKDILRRCRKAPLPVRLSERLRVVETKLAEWRKRKAEKERTGPRFD